MTFSSLEWRLNTNWQYIVIGAVILIAVIIDQSRPFLRGRRISFARPWRPAANLPDSRDKKQSC